MVTKEEEGRKNSRFTGQFVKWFSELSSKDIATAGGKGASLAEMYNSKFPVPPGFMITAQSYAYFIEKSGLDEKIKSLLEGLDIQDTEKLEDVSKEIREMISKADMPREMENEIVESYEILDTNKENIKKAKGSALEILKHSHDFPFVAVRSSATTEDLVDASFAGQQESFVNVKGKKELIEKVKECFASLFTARAVYYRKKKGFDHQNAKLAVVVQKMINSDKSGVIFSKNPISTKDTIMLEAVWGLGEGIVSGKIKPDNYLIDGNVENFKILEIKVAEKKIALTRDSGGKNITVNLTSERSKQQVLDNYEIKILSLYAKALEEHYKKPQDIEFAIEGREVYIVQSRPITTLGNLETKKKQEKKIEGKEILSGLAASPGVGVGKVKIVLDLKDLIKVKKGDVLVTQMTNPDMVISMQKAAAIVTDEGGITSHAAIVSREMGIPAVVGTGEATKILKDEQIITVDGNDGKVYLGAGEAKAAEINPVVPTRTKIKVIVDLPDYAERAALSGAKEVGLTRIEGIIAESGKHPLYFFKKGNMKDYFELIYKGLRKIAEHFDGMCVRTSDIRSDEFRHLEGAPKEVEGNPMLGDHGVRFGIKNLEILKAEAEAIIKVANDFPNKKIGLMMPQVISVSEVQKTKEIVSGIGAPDNFRLGIMVETPAAVEIINELCEEGISFISFGTNDLTQYILAIDRNNSEVQYLYDEMNPAVLAAIKYVIRRCKRSKIETSICGQAGSNPEMAKFLVENGIDSISVNADAAEKVSKIVAEIEQNNQIKQPERKKIEQEKREPQKEEKLREKIQEQKVEEKLEEEKHEEIKEETEIKHLKEDLEEEKNLVDKQLKEEEIIREEAKKEFENEEEIKEKPEERPKEQEKVEEGYVDLTQPKVHVEITEKKEGPENKNDKKMENIFDLDAELAKEED